MLLAALGLGILAFAWHAGDAARATQAKRRTEVLFPPSAAVLETDHYRIHHTASRQQAELVGGVVEKLYAAYVSVFPQPPGSTAPGKLTLILYKDRSEFKQNNRSSAWAEAYYLQPACYAYFDGSAANPYHWMTHEATHQLARQLSGFRRNRWIDEGLASYFSTSTMGEAGLQLGVPDAHAYPIWWLARYQLTGDAARDAAANQFVPLEALLTGQGGPDVDTSFNLYYVDAWSLTHFLFHYQNGKYAAAYQEFLGRGAQSEDFAALIGPIERVQSERYRYLMELQRLH
jgi:hypothetical protein